MKEPALRLVPFFRISLSGFALGPELFLVVLWFHGEEPIGASLLFAVEEFLWLFSTFADSGLALMKRMNMRRMQSSYHTTLLESFFCNQELCEAIDIRIFPIQLWML